MKDDGGVKSEVRYVEKSPAFYVLLSFRDTSKVFLEVEWVETKAATLVT